MRGQDHPVPSLKAQCAYTCIIPCGLADTFQMLPSKGSLLLKQQSHNPVVRFFHHGLHPTRFFKKRNNWHDKIKLIL